MSNNHLAQSQLTKMFFERLLVIIPLMFAMIFLPAGTFVYWEAWVYLIIFLIPIFISGIYWLKKDPELLERRMRRREKETEQKLIMKIFYLYFVLIFLLPGLDKRFEWSNVPFLVVIVADVLILLGYGLVFLVLRENRYACHTIEVEQEQKVVSSGTYAIIRHPMYLGVSLMFILTPLALGSYWAMIFLMFMIPGLAARIRNEESVLIKELKGYQEYMQKTKYRLIPGIW
jgi:protein-S-isoprenylcysteine O-methyltransferase Ste14